MFDVLLFMVLVAAFALGVGSIVYGSFFASADSEEADEAMTKKVEFGFFGVAGLIASAVLLYAL